MLWIKAAWKFEVGGRKAPPFCSSFKTATAFPREQPHLAVHLQTRCNCRKDAAALKNASHSPSFLTPLPFLHLFSYTTNHPVGWGQPLLVAAQLQKRGGSFNESICGPPFPPLLFLHLFSIFIRVLANGQSSCKGTKDVAAFKSASNAPRSLPPTLLNLFSCATRVPSGRGRQLLVVAVQLQKRCKGRNDVAALKSSNHHSDFPQPFSSSPGS